MKWWDPHTKKLKYCSSTKVYEHNNKFCKGWSTGSKLMLGKNTSNLPTLKISRDRNRYGSVISADAHSGGQIL